MGACMLVCSFSSFSPSMAGREKKREREREWVGRSRSARYLMPLAPPSRTRGGALANSEYKSPHGLAAMAGGGGVVVRGRVIFLARLHAPPFSPLHRPRGPELPEKAERSDSGGE